MATDIQFTVADSLTVPAANRGHLALPRSLSLSPENLSRANSKHNHSDRHNAHTDSSSTGLLSSLLSAAHNAAHIIGSKTHSSTESGLDNDTAKTEPSRNNSITSDTLGLTTGNSDHSATGARLLLPSNVHFAPVHGSLVQTLGNGDLSLSHFENKKAKEAATPVDRPLTPLKGNITRDKSSDKLVVLGSSDNKVVRRKSISNGSIMTHDLSDTIDTLENESHALKASEISNAKFEELLSASAENPVHPKKDKEFHQIFRKIPSAETLIADYSCALSKDILVQGKMYLSQNYICFNSNILGWVTNLVVPVREIIQIEKKSTAVLFPNGMVIRTLHHKYVFATFLSRDTTFDLITRVWHDALQENSGERPNRNSRAMSAKRRLTHSNQPSSSEGELSDDDTAQESDTEELSDESHGSPLASKITKIKELVTGSLSSTDSLPESDAGEEPAEPEKDESPDKAPEEATDTGNLPNPGPSSHGPTSHNYTKESGETQIAESTFKAPLGTVFALLYGSDTTHFVRILEKAKNFDITKDKLTELSDDHKERTYTYTKPLSGPIGPKQTKCNITETLVTHDYNKYCEVEQITKTPDVPLGGSFKVRTRQFFRWGPNNSTIMTVFSSVEWTAKSWIKSAVEKGSLDGQKTFMKALADYVNDTLSSSGSKGGKKKRKRTKSTDPAEAKESEEDSQPADKSLGGQVWGVLEQIGGYVPVPAPFLGEGGKGILILVLACLLYSFSVVAIFGRGSSDASGKRDDRGNTTSRRVGMQFPDLVGYGDRQARNAEEARLWKWVMERTHGVAHAGGEDSPKEINEDLREMIRLTKMRVDALQEGLL